MATSANGWPAITSSGDARLTVIEPVPGRKFRVHRDAAAAFDYVIRRYHAEVEPITGGILDDWSYAYRPIRGGKRYSNHASGTAIDLNATQHPLGRKGTHSAAQLRAMDRIAGDLRGTMRHGARWSRPDAMHWEVSPGTTAAQLKAAVQAAPALRQYALGERVLEVGSTGADVAALQRMLGVADDGDFGPLTHKALQAWQTAQGLDADGVYGPMSHAKAATVPNPTSTAKDLPVTDPSASSPNLPQTDPVPSEWHARIARKGSALGGTTSLVAVLAHFDATAEATRAEIKALCAEIAALKAQLKEGN